MVNTVRSFWETLTMRSSLLRRVRAHRYFPLAVLAVALLLISCVHVWQRFTVLDLVRQVSALEKEHAMLLDNTKKMYGDIAELSASQRIRRYAVDTLGMQPVAVDRLYTLEREQPTLSDPDDLAMLVSAVKRMASYFPVLTEETVAAAELRRVKIDSSIYPGGNR